MANFGIFLSLATYSRKRTIARHGRHDNSQAHQNESLLKFGAMAQTILSMILTVIVWWA